MYLNFYLDIMAVKAPQYKNMPPVNKLILKSF